jgi:hypothetical protein
MRFCSTACVGAYSERLTDDTRSKIQLLDHDPAVSAAKFPLPKLPDLIRQHLPG